VNEEKTCDIPMANTADLDAVVAAVKSAFESFSMTSREDFVNRTISKVMVLSQRFVKKFP
jgi:acyl-CoA reductase-like NAD-dependent aldehyde dehydrogenase